MSPANRSRTRGRHTGDRRPDTGESRKIRPPASPSPVSGIPDPRSRRPVRIHNGHPRLRFDRRAVATAIHLLDAHAAEILDPSRLNAFSSSFFHLSSSSPGVPPGELSLALLTDSALARLHATFLDDASKTDVITFTGTPAFGLAPTESGLAGEICVSVDAARAFAAQHGRDFSGELTLYIVHGWLHLAGYDDLRPANKKRMRAAEARALDLLRAGRMMPRFAFAGQAPRTPG